MVFLAFLSVYVFISLSTGRRVLKLGKADWTSRSTAIGRICLWFSLLFSKTAYEWYLTHFEGLKFTTDTRL
jgi:hypothetical protein